MTDDARTDDRGQDPADDFDFDLTLRLFRFEAHQVLARPEAELDDLVTLHCRALTLLEEARGAQVPETDRWVSVTRCAVSSHLKDRATALIGAGMG